MKLARIGITAVAAIALSAGLTACSTDGDQASSEGSATKVNIVNETCPFTGGDVDATQTADHNGKTVGFCCGGCVGKWNKLSDEEKSEKLASSK